MPTAARLAAALAFAALGFFAAEIYKPGLPPETQFGRFTPLCALIGLLCGWFLMGRLAGRGTRAALGSGLRTAATMVFFAMVLFSVYEMLLRALRKRYGGVFEAIEGTFDIVLIYGTALLRPEPLIVLAIGGMLCGLLVEWVSRRAS
ncbi:TrgA family protein [Gemmobacter nectariphilus]|uniref:TrgA family protein n=1 Tax=Gemmobacter nectariphilus TaxID=220343 RepID=UPI0004183C35|nr:TrgA family protein [Gemmobacter nectariphilus]